MSVSHPDHEEGRGANFTELSIFERDPSKLAARDTVLRKPSAAPKLASNFSGEMAFNGIMKWPSCVLVSLVACGIGVPQLTAQQDSSQGAPYPSAAEPGYGPTAPPRPDAGPVVLDWVPPALAALSTMAAAKSSFTLDRSLLQAAATGVADSDEPTRHAIAKLDGLSVHLLRFGPSGVPDEGAVNAIRAAYHLRGWKHVVTTTEAGGPVHNNTTDVWMVMDGVNLRGAVILAETPKSVTLVTVAGNLSPVDLLHLRGHFGIPRFEGDNLNSRK